MQHFCLPWDNLILELRLLDNRCQLFFQVLSFWVLQLCKQVVGQIFTGVWFNSAFVIGLLCQPYCLSLERLCNEEAVVTVLKLPLE